MKKTSKEKVINAILLSSLGILVFFLVVIMILIMYFSMKEYDHPKTVIINEIGFKETRPYLSQQLKESEFVTVTKVTDEDVTFNLKNSISFVKDKKYLSSEIVDKKESSTVLYNKIGNVTVPQTLHSYYLFYQEYDVLEKPKGIRKKEVNKNKFKEAKVGEKFYSTASYLVNEENHHFMILHESKE